MIDDVFSLCFGSVEGDGALLLGEVDLSSYNVELEYTPLLTSAAYPHYYSVKLMGIQVGTSTLAVPPVSHIVSCEPTNLLLTPPLHHASFFCEELDEVD